MNDRAELFDDDEFQIVLLPAAFHMPGTDVLVRREGDAVILEPLADGASIAAVSSEEPDDGESASVS